MHWDRRTYRRTETDNPLYRYRYNFRFTSTFVRYIKTTYIPMHADFLMQLELFPSNEKPLLWCSLSCVSLVIFKQKFENKAIPANNHARSKQWNLQEWTTLIYSPDEMNLANLIDFQVYISVESLVVTNNIRSIWTRDRKWREKRDETEHCVCTRCKHDICANTPSTIHPNWISGTGRRNKRGNCHPPAARHYILAKFELQLEIGHGLK